MIDVTFIFNGQKARSLGLELQSPLSLSAAVPKISTSTIPGRNGVLHYYDGSYENRDLSGEGFILSADVSKRIGIINAWLLGPKGYARLERDEDPDHFMMARCKKGINSKIVKGLLTSCNISFDCKPQRFLKYGEGEFDVTESKKLLNPTAYDALPIITIEGAGNVSISSGLWTLEFKDLSGSVTFDSETLCSYNGNVNLNAKTSLSGDVILPPGENTFTVNGSVTAIKIIPRWWEI